MINTKTKYHRIDRTYWNKDHYTRVALKAGYDEICYEYNEQNKVSRIEYLQGGRPALITDGFAVMEREYDENGNLICVRYFDENHEKTLLPDGYHFIVQSFGDDGLVASISYFGLDGEPVINTKAKYHQIDRTWQDSKHAISEAWFDIDGQPMTTGNTFVKVEREFDDRGNTAVERYYGADGEQVVEMQRD